MAKKEDLSTDFPPTDDDLDLKWDDGDFESDLTQEAKSRSSSRNPIFQTLKSTAKETGKSIVKPGTINDILRRSLPPHYAEVVSGGEAIARNSLELYDQSVKELKPRVNSISRKLEQLMPESQRKLKGFFKKIADKTESNSFNYDSSVNEDQSVQTMLSEIFQAQSEQGKVEDAKRVMRDRIDLKRHKQTTDIQSAMARSISIMSQYTVGINQNFQRRSLEIQLRTYMGQRAYFDRSIRLMEIFKEQNEAIIRNTALPEFSKIKMSERFKNQVKEKIVSKMYGKTGDFLNRGLSRAKDTITDVVDGFARSADAAEMGLDMAMSQKEMMDQMNEMAENYGGEKFGRAQVLGMIGGMYLTDLFKDKAVDKLKPFMDKNEKAGKFKEKIASIARMMKNPGGEVARFRDSDKWQGKIGQFGAKGKLFNFLDVLLEGFEDDDVKRNFAHKKAGDDEFGFGFDQRAHTSLVSVIPGHLANIHRELVMLRTGKSEAEVPRMVWDNTRNTFTTEKGMANRVLSQMRESISGKGFAWSVEKSLGEVNKVTEIPEQRQLEMRVFLSRLGSEPNVKYDEEGIQASRAYKSMPESTRELIDKYLETLGSSPEKEQHSADFTSAMSGVKQSRDEIMRSTAGDYIDLIRSGYGDVLRRAGLMRGGKHGLSEDRAGFDRLFEDTLFGIGDLPGRGGRVRSDINVKQDIKSTKPLSLLERLQQKARNFDPKKAYDGFMNTKLFNWRYKDGMGDGSRHSGPMAQDVQKNLGNDAAPGGKEIDLQTMNGAFFAAVQHLGGKIDELRNDQRFTLDSIKKETSLLGSSMKNSFMDFMNRRDGDDEHRSTSDKLKNLATNLFNRGKANVEEIRDLYQKGGIEPVIRAAKLKAGFYVNAETGEPISTMEQLRACKGIVVDRAGNVVLDAKERAEGLYDRHGQKFRDAFDRARAWGEGVASALKKQGSELYDSVKKSDFSLGGLFQKGSYEALIDIRDILLGDIDKVRKRLKNKGNKPGSKTIAASIAANSGDTPEAVEGKTTDSESPQEADTSNRYMGYAESGANLLGGAVGQVFGMGKKALPYAQKAGSVFKDKLSTNWKKLKNSDLLKQGKVGELKDKVAKKSKGIDWSAKKGKMSGLGGKIGGLFGGAGGLISSAASAASGLFGGNEEKEETGADGDNPSLKDRLRSKVDDYTEIGKKTIGRIAKPFRQWNDKDGDGERDGGVDAQADKVEKLKKARQKKTLEADTSNRYKGIQGGLGGMFDIASKFFGFLTSGIGGIFSLGTKLLTKLPGLGKLAGALGGKVSKIAGPVIKTLAKAGVKGYAGAIRFAVGTAARAVIPSMLLGGQAVMAVGGSLLTALASPFVLAPLAIGAAAYGLYYLYKRAHRDDANEYERLRLRQYGFARNQAAERYNHYVYLLEEYLQDGRVGFDQGRAYFLEKKIDPKEVFGLFNIDPEDVEQTQTFTNWMTQRFKPVFLTHQTALMSVNRKMKLSEVKDLKPEALLTYLEKAKFPDGPYNLDYSPLKDFELDVDGDEILSQYDILIQRVKKDVEKAGTGKKLLIPEKYDASTAKTDSVKNDAKTAQAAANAARDAENRRSRAPRTIGILDNGEGDGTSPSESSKPQGKVDQLPATASQTVAIASGQIADGSSGMQFIKLGPNARLEGMSPAMVKNFLGMAQEFGQQTGESIYVNQGVRSYEEQAALKRKYGARAASPGRSLHEFGLAMDIPSATLEKLDKLGLLRKYGFTRPVGGEPWHLEPAGIQANIDLAKKNQDQREMMVAAGVGKGGGGYGTVAGATKYRRNHDLAMKLLTGSSKILPEAPQNNVVNMEDGQVFKPTSSESETSTTTTVPPQQRIQEAANDASSSAPPQTSKAQTLPEVAKSPDTETPLSTNTGGEKPVNLQNASVETIKDLVARSAKKVGADPTMMMAFAAVESDLNPNAKAKGTSGAGLMQFVNGTWREQLSQFGNKFGLPANASPFDPEAASLLGANYLKNNLASLSSVKPNPNVVDAYLTHFLGPSGAKKFLSADPSEIGAKVLPNAAVNNKAIFYDGGRALTVGEIYQRLGKKIESKAKAYGISITAPTLTSTGKASPVANAPAASSGETRSASPKGVKIAQTSIPEPTTGRNDVPGKTTQPRTNPLSIDTRAPGAIVTPSGAGTQTASSMSTQRLEAIFEENVSIASQQLDVLRSIDKNLSPESLGKLIALASKLNAAPAEKEDVKQQDRRNMQRTADAKGPSVDLRRKVAV